MTNWYGGAEKVRKSIEASLDARIEYLKRFGIRESSTIEEKVKNLFEYRRIYCELMGMSEKEAYFDAKVYSEKWLDSIRR
jgi:hypothetical protein